MINTILYPIARDPDGAPIHIDDWERGQAVTCFGCEQDLIGRLPFDGIKPTAHFAHKADVACYGETALHKAAKAAISLSHAKGALQSLSWECPRCKWCLQQTDLRSVKLIEEVAPCKGIVSDVLGVDEFGHPCVAIEVVVTHDVEAETLERYRSLGIYVFKFRPSWGSVGDIVRGVDPLLVDYLVGVVDTASCEGCQQVLREKEEWAARERAQKVKAWWGEWVDVWRNIGREALDRSEKQYRALLAQRAREQVWWKAWSVWQRITEAIVGLWWIEWRDLWRELGIQHVRPYIWQRDWQEVWEAIGTHYAAREAERARLLAKEEAERARRLADEKHKENLRRYTWGPDWIRVWSEIGLRESGLIAGSRPICKKCRRDKVRDQRCPCEDV